jgi:hypothetical protein
MTIAAIKGLGYKLGIGISGGRFVTDEAVGHFEAC